MAGIPPGAHFDFATLLDPIPVSDAHVVLELLGAVPSALAPPVLQQVLRARQCLELADAEAAHVVWKFKRYLPSILGQQFTGSEVPAALKNVQGCPPELPLVHVAPLVLSLWRFGALAL